VSAGGSRFDKGQGIALDKSGNVFISGYFQKSATFGDITLVSQGDYDAFVAKLNADGVWQWAVSTGGTSSVWGKRIAIDIHYNVYITGRFKESAIFGNSTLISQGGWDVFVAKLSTNGEWYWVRSAGGNEYDEGHDVAVDSNGNAYIVGEFTSSATFGNTTLVSQGGLDVFVAKLNADGVWQWAVNAGGNTDSRGLGISVDATGFVYITGVFEGEASFGTLNFVSQGQYDLFLSVINGKEMPDIIKESENDEGIFQSVIDAELSEPVIDTETKEITYTAFVEKTDVLYIRVIDTYPLDEYPYFTLTVQTGDKNVISSDDIFRENGFIYAPIYETEEPAVYYYFIHGYDTLPVNTISGDINEQAKGASPMFIFGILGFIIFVLLIIVFFFFKRRLFYDKKTGSEKQKHKEKTKK